MPTMSKPNMERGSVALCEPIFGVKKGHGAPFASIHECGMVAVSIINPSMPLGLAGFRELIRRRPSNHFIPILIG
jgi:hypothetical protein